jgi:hypothetical protein
MALQQHYQQRRKNTAGDINGSTYCLTDRTIGNNTHKRFRRPQREKCSIIDAPSNKLHSLRNRFFPDLDSAMDSIQWYLQNAGRQFIKSLCGCQYLLH